MTRSSVIAIGKFEGVHRGHQHILARLIEEAAARDAEAVVFTFTQNPLSYLNPAKCPKPLMSPEQRAQTLLDVGIDRVIMVDFDEPFATLSPEAFVKQELVGANHVTHVIVGDDFRFGSKAAGTPEVLAELGKEFGFSVEVIDEVADAEFGRISSSRIRQALDEGDVELAARLLGAPHQVRGLVVHGDARGRELGFPTANLGPFDGATQVDGYVPADGVYGGIAMVQGEPVVAAISVGNNPTFTPEGQSRVEAYLLDFEGDIYGEEITIDFTHRIRDMVAFTGIEALIETMNNDVARVRDLVQFELEHED